MKLLIYSPRFAPSVGGVEMVTEILAREWVRLGVGVKVVSQTPATGGETFPFEVFRQPTPRQLLSLLHWCDIFIHSCISLKGIWPNLLVRKPWVCIHHTWYRRPNGKVAIPDWLKLQLTHQAYNISVSRAIAAHLPTSSQVIENPYRDDIFYERGDRKRDRGLIYVGRLVSDKGVDLLLNALLPLKQQGLTPHLTIIGTGEAEPQLRHFVQTHHLTPQVEFLGTQPPHQVAQLLNTHQILVIPSRWQEPFGIVALEGIACGCAVVGSQGGGLKDAIGDCGVTFLNGDQQQLTQILANHLTKKQKPANKDKLNAHLQQHQPTPVAQAYLQRFRTILS
ncbi:glycosyltransferase [Spirulina sp. CS-785/01]|uniref:glycosyltransferase family 4 protein n=1 Tax=Spirulina sp. CS-785/01 TaxID=3021716 RepID=UPI00232B14A0|nr:glycosyltransferase [Spirulina sp. CS-785/01]MDB9313248.1 glycosyltransferase [Spirulina sp. CS-785/01]